MKKTITVTSALPYANGEIHLGHLVETIQTDIWVRFQKMLGNDCRYFCGDDSHGTAIMIAAREAGVTPEEFIEGVRKRHIDDYKLFEIDFDNYYTTHSHENEKLTLEFFDSAQAKGLVMEKEVEMLFCPNDNVFLPDRFIKGTCPKCGAADQYGDSCDTCGSIYDPTDLKDPKCSFCGGKPELKRSVHYFLKMEKIDDIIKTWINSDALQEPVQNKMMEWFKEGLKDWDFSRDAAFFGYLIPKSDEKYFYNWWDAPIGYLASIENWCNNHNDSFKKRVFDNETELIHFIGKDIMYFHCLYWPALLHIRGYPYRLPNRVHIHGFLQINGKKMSKSRGTFILARKFAEHINPSYLRYYFASKLGNGIEDMNMGLEDFVNKSNSFLVGKISNLASRSISMINKHFSGKLAVLKGKEKTFLSTDIMYSAEAIREGYINLEFSNVIKEVASLADKLNTYMDEMKPWSTVKTDPDEAQRDLTCVINGFRILTIYLKPVLPSMAKKVEGILKIDELKWDDFDTYLEDHTIGEFERLAEKIEMTAIENLINESKEGAEEEKAESVSCFKPEISHEDFQRLDIRIARVIKAEDVEGAEKLVRLTLDAGVKTVTVIAGIKEAYTKERLEGKQVVLLANLKPRKMKFGVSEGMILATGCGKDIYMLTVDEGAKEGMEVE